MTYNPRIKISEQLDIIIINLVDRLDRRAESQTEIANAALVEHRCEFFAAKKDLDFPLRGCAKSHAMALSTFLFDSEKPFVLVLEDDFSIIEKNDFLESVKGVLTIAKEWDVALLSHSQAIPIATTTSGYVQRVLNSQTASAYIVQRYFAPTLSKLFFSSAHRLSEIANLIEPNKSLARHQLAPDIWWKTLQNEFRFVATFPPLVKQRRSFSDIEQAVVDYGV